MVRKGKKHLRKTRRVPLISNPLVVLPMHEVVTVPFHSYNTMSSAVQSFYVHPDNLGLSHLSGIANYFKLWRCKEIVVTVYPAYASGTPYSAAYSYTSDASVSAASVAEMSQQDVFVLVAPTEANPHQMVVTQALLSKITRRWLSTTAPSISNYRDTADGLFSTYTSAATSYYVIRGVLEFCDPVSSGYQLDDVLSWQSGGTPPVPQPVPVDPPNPEFKVSSSANSSGRSGPSSSRVMAVYPPDQLLDDETVMVPRKQSAPPSSASSVMPRTAPRTVAVRTQGSVLQEGSG